MVAQVSVQQILPDRWVIHGITAFRDGHLTKVIGRFMMKGPFYRLPLSEGICFGMDVANTGLLSE